jgi:uncharacterized protein
MNAFVIDAFEFCRHKERRQGEIAVADLARLAGECADKSGVVHWSLEGGVGRSGLPKLSLSVTGSVQLLCQRCLTKFAFDIASESTLILARDEENADEIEAMLEDDSIDVIIGLKALDILALIEDDALLAIPLSAKHDVCPDQASLDALMSTKKDSPFAILKGLN